MRDQIERLLTQYCIGKGINATKEKLAINAGVLAKRYSVEEVHGALKELYMTHNYFPHVSEIRIIIEGDDQSQAVEIAGAIIHAISKFGYTNEFEAKEYLGPIGWLTVQRCGGWSAMCSAKTDDLSALRAQLRTMAKVNLERNRHMPQLVAYEYQKDTLVESKSQMRRLDHQLKNLEEIHENR